MKTIYRRGLGYRYGRVMQTISGIHYNFSVPETLWPVIARARHETLDDDTPTRAYFDLIRNFRRDSWLLDLPVRRIACGLHVFRGRPAAHAGAVGRDHPVPALRHRAPDGSPRLPVERPVLAARLLQQSCRLFRDHVAGADDAVSTV